MNVAYNEDCLVAMRKMPDKTFDLAVVDPPYGLGIDGQAERYDSKHPQHSRKCHLRQDWDNDIPPAEYFAELQRVSRNQIIWGGNYMVKHLQNGHKGWIVWDKGQRGLTMSDCELAYSSFDSPTRIFVLNRVALAQQGTIHPTEKPIMLYKWLFKNYAKDGDKILDTHLGSGSSRIAAYDMGLDFTGYEISKYYFDKQEERFARHTAQLSFLRPAEEE